MGSNPEQGVSHYRMLIPRFAMVTCINMITLLRGVPFKEEHTHKLIVLIQSIVIHYVKGASEIKFFGKFYGEN
jgi:hypothetical protein